MSKLSRHQSVDTLTKNTAFHIRTIPAGRPKLIINRNQNRKGTHTMESTCVNSSLHAPKKRESQKRPKDKLEASPAINRNKLLSIQQKLEHPPLSSDQTSLSERSRTSQANSGRVDVAARISGVVRALQACRVAVDVGKSNLTVKKHDLESFLSFLVNKETDSQMLSGSTVSQAAEEVWRCLSKKKANQKKQKLSLCSRVIQDHQENVISKQRQIKMREMTQLQTQTEELQSTVSNLHRVKNELQIQIQSKISRLAAAEAMIQEQQVASKQLGEQNRQMIKQKQNLSRQLGQVRKKSEEILTYADDQQANKILHIVSKEYKRIESEVYDFGVYLQHNSKAHSFNYQSKPFSAVQKDLEKQMPIVNRRIVQGSESEEEKTKVMRDFVMKVMKHYSLKNDQVNELLRLKTTWINDFIKKLRLWLENWDIKQEYLKNLRLEFAQVILQLQTQYQDSKVCESCGCILNRIGELTRRMQEIYKLGNSFY